MVFYGLFISGIKIFAEIEKIIEKYKFLTIMGLKKNLRKKIVRGELIFQMLCPLALVAVVGSAFNFGILGGGPKSMHFWEVFLLTFTIPETKIYWCLLMVYGSIQIIFSGIVMYTLNRRIEKNIA